MSLSGSCTLDCNVALLTEGVGRNCMRVLSSSTSMVALLTEGVGRNAAPAAALDTPAVALLTEGVGRNNN